MTEIPIAPDVFRGLVALFAFAAMVMVVFGMLLPSRGETPDWLRDTQERLGMAGLNSGLFLLFAILWFVLFFILFAGLVWLLWTTFFLDYPKEKVAQWDFGFHIAQVAAFAAVFGAVVALPVTLYRLTLATRDTHANEMRLVTERLSAAVEQLGHADTAVRMGAIHLLERIMIQSPPDREMILNTLNSYLVHHATLTDEDNSEKGGSIRVDTDAALNVILRWRQD